MYVLYVGVIKEMFEHHNLQNTDIVIVNLGVWYSLGELGQGIKYEKKVSALVNELKDRSPSPKLLWMESPPQHFPGSDNGYFEVENFKNKMYDIVSMYGSDQAPSSWCRPFGDHSLAHAKDYHNRLVERLGIGLPVIPLWKYLWNISYAHVEQSKRLDGHTHGTK